MQDDLIREIAKQMAEQSQAYAGLESLTRTLISALSACDVVRIESASRNGEAELFRMRARLLQITSSLTSFADLRASQEESQPFDPAARAQFEVAAKNLLETARRFDVVGQRAKSLALAGSSFSSANIQMCGVPPTTYRAPLLKNGRGGSE